MLEHLGQIALNAAQKFGDREALIFEGTPYRYSRELFQVQTADGVQSAWVYIANPGVIDNKLMPATWYVEHLLAGREFITEQYYSTIASTTCVSHSTDPWE